MQKSITVLKEEINEHELNAKVLKEKLNVQTLEKDENESKSKSQIEKLQLCLKDRESSQAIIIMEK